MELYIFILLIVAVAELTYLVAKQPTKSLKSTGGRPIFVDTSVLIDGRIIAVAKSGFVTDTLVIPRSVIGELQFLADNGDHDKRARARYGLDVAQELQALDTVKVEILQDGNRASEGVDNQLLHLAKQYSGTICTIDYNLNKVANVEGIVVLNVNDLAMSLRMAYLPGERIMLEITQKGNEQHQGVGHLPDGTMVVVEQASSLVGKRIEVEFIRSLQTAAGKMMFAKLTNAKNTKGVFRGQSTSKPTGAAGMFANKQASGEPTEGMFAKLTNAKNTKAKPAQQPKLKPKQPKQNNDQAKPQQNQAQPQRQQGRRNNRRVDHEDNLINLVNNQ